MVFQSLGPSPILGPGYNPLYPRPSAPLWLHHLILLFCLGHLWGGMRVVVLLAPKRVLRNRGSLRRKNSSSDCISQACWGGLGLPSLAARHSGLFLVCLGQSVTSAVTWHFLCDLDSEPREEIIGWMFTCSFETWLSPLCSVLDVAVTHSWSPVGGT